VFDNSFSWFLVNMAISAFWLAGAVATHDYFVALGALFFIGVALLIDLPASSSEERSADEDAKLGRD
jgi:hypothetical protein